MAKIVAVTACIAGIAHTYMAAENLKKYAVKDGDTIKVETQGALGIENRLSQDEIDDADVVIFAVDTNVAERDRFEGKKILEIGTTDVVKDGEAVIKEAMEQI
jgi:PTS system fructose-specific IIB component/fructose-specific PTS system IIB-like component